MKNHSEKKQKTLYTLYQGYCWVKFVWFFLFCSSSSLLTWYSQWRNAVCPHAQWLRQKSLSSLFPPCVSFLCPCTQETRKRALQQNSSLLMSQSGLCGSQIANTYTKPNGLLVMRKSFLPWPTSRFKTASVSSPLRMNLPVKEEDRMLFNVQQSAGRIQRVERVVLPRSSMIHLYMKPFRWTIPIASWGLHKCSNNRFSKTTWHFLWCK